MTFINATVPTTTTSPAATPRQPLRTLQLIAAALEPTPDVLRYRAALAALTGQEIH